MSLRECDGYAALARFPSVARALLGAVPAAASSVAEACATLYVDGRHLTSVYDREAEARLQATRIADDAVEATVYGIALGDLPTVLLERSTLKRLRVVMLAPQVVAATILHGVDHVWAHDPRVTVELGAEQTVLHRPYAVSPACLALAEPASAPVRDALLLDLTAPFQAEKHALREPGIAAAMVANEARLRSDQDVARLFGSKVGATAIIAAAGPTLSEAMGYLQRRSEGTLLVAVTTALRPLHAASVRPDYAVILDPQLAMGAHFDDLPDDFMAAVPLVYVPAVHPDVLQRWRGPRYAAYLKQPRYRESALLVPRGALFASGTVTHAAVDLAVQMGASDVVLLGTDFAYVRGRSHANGAAHERGAPRATECWVLDGEGERVTSDLSMVGFLRDLERYISQHPEVRFHALSRRGARIRGTTWI